MKRQKEDVSLVANSHTYQTHNLDVDVGLPRMQEWFQCDEGQYGPQDFTSRGQRIQLSLDDMDSGAHSASVQCLRVLYA
jgi:hypothetical protein